MFKFFQLIVNDHEEILKQISLSFSLINKEKIVLKIENYFV